MKAKSLEELQIWRRAVAFASAVSAITETPAFNRDIKLREQIDDCIDSVVSNIGEGFGQATDRAFANYLAISRGSALEAKSHLAVAVARRRISAPTYEPLAQEATELAMMLSAFIRYLRRSDWKDRF